MPKFRCEHCRQKIAAPESHIGKRVRCPRCKQAVRVPEFVEPTAAPPATEPARAGPIYVAAVAVAPPEPPPAADPIGLSESVITRRREDDFSSVFGTTEPPAAHPTPDFAPVPLAPPPRPQEEFWNEQPAPQGHEPNSLDYDDFVPDPPAEPEPEPSHGDHQEAQPATVAEFVVAPSEVIEAPARRRQPALNSAAEVADLLRTLDPPAAAPSAPHVLVAPRPARSRHAASVTTVLLGWTSLLAGLAAVALSFANSVARYAVPVGSAGVILALAGMVLAVGRRTRGAALPAGGVFASAAGIVLALLGANGVLPIGGGRPVIRSGLTPVVNLTPSSGAAPAFRPDEYLPATSPLIANNIEVRIASVMVLHPAVYTGDYYSLHTLSERRMQITLELKNVGSTRATYDPWRRTDDTDEARLTDADGTLLRLESLPNKPDLPATAPIGALEGRTSFAPRERARTDVLLFDPPEKSGGSFKLDLPGANLGAPNTTLRILIPAEMVQTEKP